MSSLLEDLNAAQKQAVLHETGPLLIVAGAGTGKTTVLTRRYAALLERCCQTYELLALTFTEKAAEEMEDRVIKLLPIGTYDFWISTFHGFCQRLLEAHGLEIGLPNRFKLLTPTDSWLLLKRNLHALPLNHYRPLGNPTKFLQALVTHVSRVKDEGVSPEHYLTFALEAKLNEDSEEARGERKRLEELAGLYAVYQKILHDESALDFGDLILGALRLFRERPAILKTYQTQFKHILVDEFQDTNWAQYELLKLLTGEKKNLTVVGDDDQAIYKFRGASLANILQFRDDFPEAATVALSQNYRTKQHILDKAYGFIRKNDPNRLEVKLNDTGLSKLLQAARGAGGDVLVIWEASLEGEARAVGEIIRQLKESDAEASWNDFAVLVRSNDSAEPFIRFFEENRIPFQFLALRGLYAKPTVLDIIALLSLLDNFHESPYVWRVLQLQVFGLAALDVAEIIQYANRKGISLWSTVTEAAHGHPNINVSEEGRVNLRKLITLLNKLRETARTSSTFQIFQAVVQDSGYLAWLIKLPENEKRDRLSHLNGLYERIKRYEHSLLSPSLPGFLEEFRLEVESGEEGALDFDPEAGPEMVKIMTVHASKGLEFKYVFVVSMVDQRFPTRARGEAIPLPDGLVKERLPEAGDLHVEEERRLFYVALTRAKDKVILSGAENYGGARQKKPSSFLTEMGMEVLRPTSYVRRRDLGPRTQDQGLVSPIIYNLKRRFSFTQLAAYKKCPLQYKFAHIYRLPVLGSYQRSFGQSVHLSFQRILELHKKRSSLSQGSLFSTTTLTNSAGFCVSEEEALDIFEGSWIDEWYPNRQMHDEMKKTGIKAVKNLIKACADNLPDVLELEKPFTLVLGRHSVKGKIDRLDNMVGRAGERRVAILDYKTGAMKTKLEADDREQLYLYQLALEKMGYQVGKLSYIYVQDWVSSDIEPLEAEEKQTFLDKMTARMDDILGSDFAPTPDSFVCRYCDFNKICEYRKM